MGPAVQQHVVSTESAILDLRRQYSDLVHAFAKDSADLHGQVTDHDAALVHFRDTISAQGAAIDALTTMTFWQRMRWFCGW